MRAILQPASAQPTAFRNWVPVGLEVDTLVSACPWSERPLSQAGDAQGIDVLDLFELLALSAGIEVGGHRRGPAPAEAGL